MPKVKISKNLFKEIHKKFGTSESELILDKLELLEKEPHKGKLLTTISNIHLKELKYKSFRFYFLTDGHVLKFGNKEEISNLLIKFVRMSDKKNQQKVINEIKEILENLGFESF